MKFMWRDHSMTVAISNGKTALRSDPPVATPAKQGLQ